MPVCVIIWKAFKVWRALSRIKRVKANAYRESIGLPPQYGCCHSILQCFLRACQAIFLRILCPCCFWKAKDGRSTWTLLCTDGTLLNSTAKSLLGLILGLTLTHLIAIFLIFQLNFDPIKTTYISILLGTVLTLSLAFSVTSRCFLFLTLPQFFTKKGRAAILAYCLILAISGPGKNTTKNMEILTESLLCSQEMAHNATQGLIDLVRDPYSALGGALKSMVDAVKNAADSIMTSLRHLIKMVVIVVDSIKAVVNWLKDIMSFCDTKVGSPSMKCRAAFDEAIADCKVRLGAGFGWMCSVADLAKNLCHIAEWSEGVICWLPGLIKENVLEPIKDGLKDIGAAIKTFFDVRIKFDYELDASFTSSKGFRDVVRGMKTEILEEIHWLLDYMDWVNVLASLFMGLALYKALIYRHRFLTIDRHDNFYITKGIVQLDLRMRRIGKERIFPLKYRESFIYVQPFSLVLVESERKALKTQLLFVALASIKILIYVSIDYVFYLFLLLVQKYGALHVDTRKLLGHGVTVSGHGFMAAMYRAILEALSPIGSMLPVFDTSSCLPVPSIPNYYRYAMIFFLLVLCFVACVTEPYGMRLRHIICGIYYPDRKLPRDRWLYTHIVTTRGNFIEYARHELKSMLSNGKTTYRIGIAQRLSHMSPCFRMLFQLLRMRRKKCFLCGLAGDMDDTENFVHCPSCDSIYCNACFDEVGGRCVACMSPIEFGDISDESGSHSSSDEDVEMKRRVQKILKLRKQGVSSSRRKEIVAAASNSSENMPLLRMHGQSDLDSSSEDDDTLSEIGSTKLDIRESSDASTIVYGTPSEATSASAEEASDSSPNTESNSDSESVDDEALIDLENEDAVASSDSFHTFRSVSAGDFTEPDNSEAELSTGKYTESRLLKQPEDAPGHHSNHNRPNNSPSITATQKTHSIKEALSTTNSGSDTSSGDKHASEKSTSNALFSATEDSSNESNDEKTMSHSSSEISIVSSKSGTSKAHSSVQSRQTSFKMPLARTRTIIDKLDSESTSSSEIKRTSGNKLKKSISAAAFSKNTSATPVSDSSSRNFHPVQTYQRQNATLESSNFRMSRTSASDTISHVSVRSSAAVSKISDSSSSTSAGGDSSVIRPEPRRIDFVSRNQSADASTSDSRTSSSENSDPASEVANTPESESPQSSDASSSPSAGENTSDVSRINPFCVQSSSSSDSDAGVPESQGLDSGKFRRGSIPRRRVNSTLAERVARLDSFYSKMPFPPCSNVYN